MTTVLALLAPQIFGVLLLTAVFIINHSWRD